jgi:hypothetical protein
MGKYPFFGLPGEVDDDPLDPDVLVKVISSMYLPAGDAESADELISHADLVESIRSTIVNVNSTAVYDSMINIGFRSRTIEGTIFWLVYNA